MVNIRNEWLTSKSDQEVMAYCMSVIIGDNLTVIKPALFYALTLDVCLFTPIGLLYVCALTFFVHVCACCIP